MDSNAIFAILLLLAGIGILSAEVFIPSGGLLGIVTFVALVGSLGFAYRAWASSNPNLFYAFCGAQLLLVPLVVGIAFYILPHTSLGKRVLLEAPAPEQLMPFSKEFARMVKLIGHFGTTVTTLNPGGIVLMEGERFHVFSEGIIVELGQSIEVLAVRGSRLLVRPGRPPEQNDSPATAKSSSLPLDFEFPQS